MKIFGVSLSEPLSVELAGAFLWYIYICIHGQSIWSHEGTYRSHISWLSKGQRSHNVGEMGENVIDLVLCFILSLAYSGSRKNMAYIQMANRTIELSPNVAAIRAD